MKLNKSSFVYMCAMAFFAAAAWVACTPNSKNLELGPKPKASFTVSPISGKVNTYLLTNTTTPSSFFYKWDNGDGSGAREGKAIDTAYYPEKGIFTVKLLVLNNGGYDTVSQVINVAADDPNGCAGKKALLTDCNTKTWVLDQPGAGALWVGDPGGAQWWSNGAADVTAADRTCLFNDEYTFKKDGTFIFADKGDFRVDDENGAAWPVGMNLSIGCYNTTQIPAQYTPWGSGTFTFKVIGGNKLQVNGLGAHLGLYKAGENGTIDMPETSNTYEILEMTSTKMVVRKLYSWGQWKFTFKVK